MAIKAVCECGKKFQAKDEYEGKRAKCPACGRTIVFLHPESPENAVEFTETNNPRWPSRGRVASIIAAAVLASVLFGWLARDHLGERPKVQLATSEKPDPSKPLPFKHLYALKKDFVNKFMKKRIVDAELKKKISLDELRSVALEIKNLDPSEYDYGFINFIISGWKDDQGWWAQALWSKDSPFEVHINGMSTKDEQFDRVTPLELPSGSSPLGTWFRDADFGSGRQTIYELSGRYFYHIQFAGDGKISALEMDEIPSNEGIALRMRGSTDVYTILPNGDLMLKNGQGKLLFRLSPMIPPPPPR